MLLFRLFLRNGEKRDGVRLIDSKQHRNKIPLHRAGFSYVGNHETDNHTGRGRLLPRDGRPGLLRRRTDRSAPLRHLRGAFRTAGGRPRAIGCGGHREHDCRIAASQPRTAAAQPAAHRGRIQAAHLAHAGSAPGAVARRHPRGAVAPHRTDAPTSSRPAPP